MEDITFDNGMEDSRTANKLTNCELQGKRNFRIRMELETGE